MGESWFVDRMTDSAFLRWKKSGRKPSTSSTWRCYNPSNWTLIESLLPFHADAVFARLSPSGRFLAELHYDASQQLSVSVLDRDKGFSVSSHRVSGNVEALVFTKDEQHIVISCLTAEHTKVLFLPVSSLNGSIEERSYQRKTCRIIASHPSNRWLAVEYGMRLGIIDRQKPDLIELFSIGGNLNLGPVLLKQLQNSEVQEQVTKWEKELPSEQMLQLRKEYEAQIKLAREASPTPVERLLVMEFSPDGRLLLCGTNAGLRVFEWATLLQGDPQKVEWKYAVGEHGLNQFKDPGKQMLEVQALDYDVSRKRVLFGGPDGKLRYLDIDSNDSGILLDESDESPIRKIAITPDRSAVVMTRRPDTTNRNKQREKFQIWNYPALCGRVDIAC